jgi:hypothetical protein
LSGADDGGKLRTFASHRERPRPAQWSPLQDEATQDLIRTAQGHNVYRFSNTGEFLRLLEGAGLIEVAVTEHATTYSGGRIAFSWWDDPSRQRIQGIFRDAIAEVGVSMPSDVGHRHFVRTIKSAAGLSLL